MTLTDAEIAELTEFYKRRDINTLLFWRKNINISVVGLAKLILNWWKEARHYKPFDDGEDEPEFVIMAKRILINDFFNSRVEAPTIPELEEYFDGVEYRSSIEYGIDRMVRDWLEYQSAVFEIFVDK